MVVYIVIEHYSQEGRGGGGEEVMTQAEVIINLTYSVITYLFICLSAFCQSLLLLLMPVRL